MCRSEISHGLAVQAYSPSSFSFFVKRAYFLQNRLIEGRLFVRVSDMISTSENPTSWISRNSSSRNGQKECVSKPDPGCSKDPSP